MISISVVIRLKIRLKVEDTVFSAQWWVGLKQWHFTQDLCGSCTKLHTIPQHADLGMCQWAVFSHRQIFALEDQQVSGCLEGILHLVRKPPADLGVCLSMCLWEQLAKHRVTSTQTLTNTTASLSRFSWQPSVPERDGEGFHPHHSFCRGSTQWCWDSSRAVRIWPPELFSPSAKQSLCWKFQWLMIETWWLRLQAGDFVPNHNIHHLLISNFKVISYIPMPVLSVENFLWGTAGAIQFKLMECWMATKPGPSFAMPEIDPQHIV